MRLILPLLVFFIGHSVSFADIAYKTVLLENNVSGACASGVLFTSGQIVTVQHAISNLCSFKIGNDQSGYDCKNLRISLSETPGAKTREILSEEYTLWKQLKGFDFAILLPKTFFESNAHNHNERESKVVEDTIPLITNATSKISISSYPGCKELITSSGKVTNIEAFNFRTTVKGNFGSSGGAIFDENSKLIGIVQKANSTFRSLFESILGDFFVSGTQLPFSTEEELNNYIFNQKKLLLKLTRTTKEYYLSQVKSLQGIRRIFGNYTFKAYVSELARYTLSIPDSSKFEKIFGLRDLYPSEVLSELELLFRQKRFNSSLTLLGYVVLAYSLEQKGLYQSATKPILTQELDSSLLLKADKEYLDLLHSYISFPGMQWMILSTSLLYGFVFLSILSLALLSTGYAYSRISGSRKRRLFLSGLILIVAWPISWLFFYIRSKRTS
jgi:hypothetical protein